MNATMTPIPSEVYAAIRREYGHRALDVRWDGPIHMDVPVGHACHVACRPPLVRMVMDADTLDAELTYHVLTLRQVDERSRYGIGICPVCNRGYWGIYGAGGGR